MLFLYYFSDKREPPSHLRPTGQVAKSHTNKTDPSTILQVASSVKKQAPLSQTRPDPKVKITTNFPYFFSIEKPINLPFKIFKKHILNMA